MDTRVFASKHLVAYLQDLLQEVDLATSLCGYHPCAVDVRQCSRNGRHCATGRRLALRQSTTRTQYQHACNQEDADVHTHEQRTRYRLMSRLMKMKGLGSEAPAMWNRSRNGLGILSKTLARRR